MANELMLPPYLYPSEVELEMADTVGQFNPMFGYATSQRVDYGATRWKGILKFEKLRTSERAALLAFINKVGRLNAFYSPVYGEAQLGSGTFTELFSNNTFVNGTTGWTLSGSGGAGTPSATVSDRVLRLLMSGGPGNGELSQAVTGTQYAPHILRALIEDCSGSSALNAGPAISLGAGVQSTDYSVRGLRSISGVFIDSGAMTQYPLVFLSAPSRATITMPWCSLSRCALVDNGPNDILQSQTFQTTWAPGSSNCTVVANQSTAPDGTATDDYLQEVNSTNVEHYISIGITVPTAAADYSYSVSLKSVTRSWAIIRMYDVTGEAYAFINLSTGALGTATTTGVYSNARAHVVNQGSGWYRVSITARKPSGITSIQCIIQSSTADNDFDYAGSASTNAISMWGASLAQSSVPVRYTATTTAATTGTAPTGSSMYTKGWAASTDGLLKAGDFVNIITPNGLHLARLTAALNTDAAGLAHMQFAPSLPESPANGAAVIPNFPLLKCVATSAPRVRTYPPGYISDVEIEVEGVF